ncbi:Rrp15p-domain-containing protein [Limtongia smithiae]|uniref:Rrp15p-domain-containing protein n=1 Tax=Limtongia smithiae TaxID=1125753 RepID=UPI0034CEB89F
MPSSTIPNAKKRKAHAPVNDAQRLASGGKKHIKKRKVAVKNYESSDDEPQSEDGPAPESPIEGESADEPEEEDAAKDLTVEVDNDDDSDTADDFAAADSDDEEGESLGEIHESELEDGTSDEDDVENDDNDVEVGRDDVSDNSDGSDGEVELSSDEEIEQINASALESRKRTKKNNDPEAFSSAISAILSSHLKAHDRSDPILVRSKGKAKAIEDQKLEAKARRELRLEKIKLLDRERIKDVLTGVREGETPTEDAARLTSEHEKRLKQTAKRGVVKLFNTVMEAQRRALQNFAV